MGRHTFCHSGSLMVLISGILTPAAIEQLKFFAEKRIAFTPVIGNSLTSIPYFPASLCLPFYVFTSIIFFVLFNQP